MSVEENKALVRRFVREVFEEGRVQSVDELVADDFVGHTWGQSGSKVTLKETMARLATALSDVRFEIEDVVGEGDTVVVRLVASARQTGEFMGLPPSGRSYRIGEIHMFKLRDGLIAEHWHQYDQLGLMKQLGAMGG